MNSKTVLYDRPLFSSNGKRAFGISDAGEFIQSHDCLVPSQPPIAETIIQVAIMVGKYGLIALKKGDEDPDGMYGIVAEFYWERQKSAISESV